MSHEFGTSAFVINSESWTKTFGVYYNVSALYYVRVLTNFPSALCGAGHSPS